MARMQRIWLPFRSGRVAIAAATNVRFFMRSLIEGAMDRDLTQFTVTRMIFGFSCALDGNVASDIMSLGIRFENENVAIGVVRPDNDSTAAWLYWEEVVAANDNVGSAAGVYVQRDRIFRDIATQRKTRGNDTELLFYVTNPGAVAGDLMLSGRALVLVP